MKSALNNYHHFLILLILSLSLGIVSCKSVTTSTDDGIEDSLGTVEEVELIQGASNVTLIVNSGDESYFDLEFQNIEDNDLIANGLMDGWCIDWKTPISTQNGTYTGIQLYSTYGVEKWNEVNALLNIREQLKADDSSITFREIQAAIWVLRPHPAFDLDDIDIDSLPNDMVRNGELLFDAQKVGEIVETAKTKAKSFTYGDETKFVVIAETPVDVQTVITVVSKK
jgi:hypothetical protein